MHVLTSCIEGTLQRLTRVLSWRECHLERVVNAALDDLEQRSRSPAHEAGVAGGDALTQLPKQLQRLALSIALGLHRGLVGLPQSRHMPLRGAGSGLSALPHTCTAQTSCIEMHLLSILAGDHPGLT